MPLVRMASASVPSGAVTTCGRFSMAPMPRMATCGWLMIGVPAKEPNPPGLVMVKVPSLHFVRGELLGAGALAEVVDGPGHAEE